MTFTFFCFINAQASTLDEGHQEDLFNIVGGFTKDSDDLDEFMDVVNSPISLTKEEPDNTQYFYDSSYDEITNFYRTIQRDDEIFQYHIDLISSPENKYTLPGTQAWLKDKFGKLKFDILNFDPTPTRLYKINRFLMY